MRKSFSALIIPVVAIFAGAALAQDEPIPPVPPGGGIFAWSVLDADGGYLGIQTEEITRENHSKFGLSSVRGVAVSKVIDGSPAATAGLKAGDVILKINGEEVTGTRKLTRLISEIAPDHEARLTIFRDGSEREINVTVGRRPMPKITRSVLGGRPDTAPDMDEIEKRLRGYLERIDELPARPLMSPKRQIGVSLMPLTEQLNRFFKVDGGVLVTEVREGSPAQKAGILAGDVIVEADGKAVKDVNDLIETINSKNAGEVNITIVRNGKRQMLKATPEDIKPMPPAQRLLPPDGRIKRELPPAPLPLSESGMRGRIV